MGRKESSYYYGKKKGIMSQPRGSQKSRCLDVSPPAPGVIKTSKELTQEQCNQIKPKQINFHYLKVKGHISKRRLL